jgi:hypothetical protein
MREGYAERWAGDRGVGQQREVNRNLAKGIGNMSDSTYSARATRRNGKPLRWLHGEIQTPPIALLARLRLTIRNGRDDQYAHN